MKKLAFLFLLVGIIMLTACDQQEIEQTTVKTHITKQEIYQPFTFDMIPESLRSYEEVVTEEHVYVEMNKYRSPLLLKLHNSFAYSEELLDNFNLMINEVIDEDDLVVGELVETGVYSYSLKHDEGHYIFQVMKGDTMMIQGVTNLHGNYDGVFNLEGDDLEFSISENHLSLTYFDADENSVSEQEIMLDDGIIKVSINYQDDDENYQLTSVGDTNYSAIYVDNYIKNQKRITVNDQAGFVLYESVTSNGTLDVSGYHLHALEGFNTLYKIGDETYLVDDSEFGYHDEGSNLYEVELSYLSENGGIVMKDVIILGTLEGEIDDLALLRTPFTSDHFEVINRIHDLLINYGVNQP